MDPTLDIEVLRGWIGRRQQHRDLVSAGPARRMQQLLDRPPSLCDGDDLPFLWHWLYLIDTTRQSDLGADGHPARGGFLPPVSLTRRMWVGGSLHQHGQLRVGDHLTRVSTIEDVTIKDGSTGPLCFVAVHHQIEGPNGASISERQDIVYRAPPGPTATPRRPQSPPSSTSWMRTIRPDPVMLFRYSALTFNGHRIHYDRPYATEVESYDGLVFQGPLTATLLADLALTNQVGPLASFTFRAVAPLLDTEPFRICGNATDTGANLWAETPEGHLAMSASAGFAD